ncbi:MAG TPA: hypothetical protein VFG42_25885 [Baekduia sp.]|uniref:hypothetical protein n=1 Tax=Baekduia sp. TaxID=2600305 RepID=UPI002D785E4F|nr:hypothetical protein [Baekduia sp.]HET6510250.1 hypothetical protein [Baekduia sp.]
MPSNRLAFLSVAVGCALLGWATAGVAAIGSGLPRGPARSTEPAITQQQVDLTPDERRHDHGRAHGRPGV